MLGWGANDWWMTTWRVFISYTVWVFCQVTHLDGLRLELFLIQVCLGKTLDRVVPSKAWGSLHVLGLRLVEGTENAVVARVRLFVVVQDLRDKIDDGVGAGA